VIPNDRSLLGEPEGDALPANLRAIPVLDAHVHVFPDRVLDAIWQWFETHGWPIRYKLHSDALLDHLAERGVGEVLALHYAHKPGMSRALNDHVLEVARRRAGVIPCATVFPGEKGARELLHRAFGEGARAVKIHCHVQKVAPDDPRLDEVFEECENAGRPVVMHAGREPSSNAYGIDTRALCSAAATARVLARHPGLTLVIPHMGADEFDEYERLLDLHPNLYLDTTMVVAGYLPAEDRFETVKRRWDRVLYGTDFPNLPFAWDREIKRLAALGLSEPQLQALFGGTARRIFGSSVRSAPARCPESS
jgi:predicted TIM-barrel fold metal-dependent hydrolase